MKQTALPQGEPTTVSTSERSHLATQQIRNRMNLCFMRYARCFILFNGMPAGGLKPRQEGEEVQRSRD